MAFRSGFASASAALLRGAASLMSPAGNRARLAILIFHQVLVRADPLRPDEPDAARFTRQLEALATHFRVLPLAEAIDRLNRGALPARAACITFDDGYADNAEVALPLLQRFGLHATFFVATGFLDGGCMWNDRVIEAVRVARGPRLELSASGLGSYMLDTVAARLAAVHSLIAALKYLPVGERAEKVETVAAACGTPARPRLMMTRAQVRALAAAGMDVGGHTVNHPILTRLDRDAARAEIAEGKEQLQDIVGRRVSLFAYPNGRPRDDYSAEHVALVRESGFDAAVSTSWGAARVESDRFQLPRFTPWDETPARFALRLVRNYTQRVALA